jgi:predicted metalloprotease with PDZ domain
MKNSILALLTLFVSVAFANDPEGYTLKLDLKNIENDQVEVTLFVPTIHRNTVIYNMPKIIPGTYSISNFGRFVEGIKAFDSTGVELPIEKLDENRWQISNAKGLSYLNYKVKDSFDEPRAAGIFEPAGTNIEAGENVVLNTFGFVGYLDHLKKSPYEVEILRPEKFYGETSLPRVSTGDSLDVFAAKDYFQLHDCPMLYCVPDTAAMYVDDTRIVVSVYSPTGVVKAAEVLDLVDELFPAASEYLGGDLPTDQYSILIYLTKGFGGSGGFGALEHNTSTVCVLPETPIASLAQTIKDVVAHEFFHIVTPLNIHSEEIDDYDFMNPEMSKHLWLYEGCTEYAAQHVQVKYGMMSVDEFLDVMKTKMIAASSFDSGIAFTEMSKKALDEHEDQYLNVYQKGALIGMALDLKLLHLSDGEYGIQDLMRDLSAEYGVDRPFEDDRLFLEIGRVSGYLQITPFLEKHIGGTEPLPFTELLGYAGIDYEEEITKNVVSGGGAAIGYNPKTERMVVVGIDKLDDFGKDLGFERGDEIMSWNGVEIESDKFRNQLDAFKKSVSKGDKVIVMVARKKDDGTYQEKKLKGKVKTVERTLYNYVEVKQDITEEQKRIRDAWLIGS